MKLKNFYKDNDLNQILSKIGASRPNNYSIQTKINYLNPDEMRKLETTGIEINLNDLRIAEDKTYEYKGQKIIIYIKNQWKYPDSHKEYKFHIADCETQISMRKKGKSFRYIISLKKDGYFLINFTHPVTRVLYAENVEEKMNVCKNCLNSLLKFYPKDEIFNYQNFTIDKYLKKYETRHSQIPKYNSDNAPKNVYTKDFHTLSRQLKERVNWVCQECGKNMINDKKNLHTHHKNAIKNDNRPSNLQVICYDCHKRKPHHSTLKKR